MLTYACARKRGNARLVGGAGPIELRQLQCSQCEVIGVQQSRTVLKFNSEYFSYCDPMASSAMATTTADILPITAATTTGTMVTPATHSLVAPSSSVGTARVGVASLDTLIATAFQNAIPRLAASLSEAMKGTLAPSPSTSTPAPAVPTTSGGMWDLEQINAVYKNECAFTYA